MPANQIVPRAPRLISTAKSVPVANAEPHKTATTTMNIVTPAPSQETEHTHHDCDWFMAQLESGAASLSFTGWEKLKANGADRHWDTIPWLDQSLLVGGGDGPTRRLLVRARGMVQDIFDAEYFATTASSTRGSNQQQQQQNMVVVDEQYDGRLAMDLQQPPNLAERTPLLVTPIPFATPWFRHVVMDHGSSSKEPTAKRLRLFHHGGSGDSRASVCQQESAVSSNNTTWPTTANSDDPTAAVSFLAKLYYDQYPRPTTVESKLLLNQMVEVVGVLDMGTTTGDVADATMDDGGVPTEDLRDEWGNSLLPPSHVLPRIHVLWYQAVDLDSLLVTDHVQSATQFSAPTAAAAAILAKVLSVSEVAANALWMALLSMAERQPQHETLHWAPVFTPQETTLGCASLNMILPTAKACTDMANSLLTMLSQVVPQVQCHTIGTGVNDDASFMLPTRRHGRLAPSPLQLVKGATLILNIGSLQQAPNGHVLLSPGQLEQLEILQKLAASHRMTYTFDGGMKIAFEADVRIIVLSTKDNSQLLPCPLHVACMQKSTLENDAQEMASSLGVVRNMLSAVRSGPAFSSSATLPSSKMPLHRNISLSQELLEQAQKDFVQRRQSLRNQNAMILPNDQDFHRWLTLTRLQARSRGSKTASISDWERAVALDDAMRATIIS